MPQDNGLTSSGWQGLVMPLHFHCVKRDSIGEPFGALELSLRVVDARQCTSRSRTTYGTEGGERHAAVQLPQVVDGLQHLHAAQCVLSTHLMRQQWNITSYNTHHCNFPTSACSTVFPSKAGSTRFS